jgi:hypothetical protein
VPVLLAHLLPPLRPGPASLARHGPPRRPAADHPGPLLRQVSRFLAKSVHDRGFPGFLLFAASRCRLLSEKARDEELAFRACEEILRGSGRSVSRGR